MNITVALLKKHDFYHYNISNVILDSLRYCGTSSMTHYTETYQHHYRASLQMLKILSSLSLPYETAMHKVKVAGGKKGYLMEQLKNEGHDTESNVIL